MTIVCQKLDDTGQIDMGSSAQGAPAYSVTSSASNGNLAGYGFVSIVSPPKPGSGIESPVTTVAVYPKGGGNALQGPNSGIIVNVPQTSMQSTDDNSFRDIFFFPLVARSSSFHQPP